jgi:hypothetical protein
MQNTKIKISTTMNIPAPGETHESEPLQVFSANHLLSSFHTQSSPFHFPSPPLLYITLYAEIKLHQPQFPKHAHDKI